MPPRDAAFLERAWAAVATAAGKAKMMVVFGTERIVSGATLASVVDRDGTSFGCQNKLRIDPLEEGIYSPGSARRISALCFEKAEEISSTGSLLS